MLTLQLIRGMDKTVEFLVKELAKLSSEVTDSELKDVATVSAGGNDKVRVWPRPVCVWFLGWWVGGGGRVLPF